MKETLKIIEWQTQANFVRPAIKDGSQIVTYSALAAWTDAVAIQISAQDLDPTKPIAYLGSQGINLIVAFLASQKAGYPFLPINNSLPPKLVGKFLMLSNSSLCITDQEKIFQDELKLVQTITLAPQPSDQMPKFQLASVDERAIALLHCSSGSSGDPKIIPHSRMALQGFINLHRDEYRLTQTDVVAHMNNFWLESVMATFSVGATLSCFDPSYSSLRSITERILSEKVSVLPLYPALLRTFHGVGECLPKLRLVMVSGEAITKSDVMIFESITSIGSILLNCYSSQEVIWVTSYRHRNGDPMLAQLLPIGQPINQMEVQIVSKDSSLLSAGEIGEIVIRSNLLPSAYLGDYSHGSKRFYNDQTGIPVYASQDLGYLDSSGNLHYVGRHDDQLKIRGHLVDVKEVENVISEVFTFDEMAVSSTVSTRDQNQIACFYVANEHVEKKEITDQLRNHIPNYMIPSYFHKVDKLPRTASGKVIRRELYKLQPEIQHKNHSQTITWHEKIVSNIMAEVLGHTDFSCEDDFLDVGGDSLSALTLRFRLEARFGISLPLEGLFLEGASVELMANKIVGHTKNTDIISLVPLNYASTSKVFYALPTLNGHLSDYVVLGEAMSTSAKIMGIRFNSLFLSVWRKPLSLKKLATEAANKIIEQKSSGKINLIGYSAAGLLAYETAKALQEHGHEINNLILIDSDPTFKKLKWPILLKFVAGIARSISRKIRRKENWANDRSYSHLHLQNQLVDQCITPIAVNRPILFVAQLGSHKNAKIERWQAMALNNLEVVPIAGDHFGLRQMDIAMDIAQKISKK